MILIDRVPSCYIHNVSKINDPGLNNEYRPIFIALTSLSMSEVDPVWAWGGQTSTPPISKYFSEMFSPSHITHTNNNLNKDFKSVKRP